MEPHLLEKIDSINELKENGFKISLNPLRPTLLEIPTKIFQVVSDMFNTKLIEHDVVKVVDGKTKYNPNAKVLYQSIRYILKKGLTVDIFNEDETVEYSTYKRNKVTFDCVSYFFITKEKAINKLRDENYRLLIRDITQN